MALDAGLGMSSDSESEDLGTGAGEPAADDDDAAPPAHPPEEPAAAAPPERAAGADAALHHSACTEFRMCRARAGHAAFVQAL